MSTLDRLWKDETARRNALLGAYAAGVAAFYAALWLRGRGAFDPAPPSPAAPVDDPDAWPLVSVIVPARNEERNIRGCVESLLAQDYPAFEVIVVDDGSTDATPRILAELAREAPGHERLRALRVETLPPGWAGKPHALHTGAEAARGRWLLFTDADTRHAPDALCVTMRTALDRRLDLLSLGTKQDLPDFWGRTLMPLAYMGIAMQYPPQRVNDPKSSLAIANGQYILIRAATYWRVGGYAAPQLRSTILDDRDLAATVKRAGGRLQLVDGRDLVQTRMYTNLREHWRGWGKNAYAGSRGGPLIFLAFIVGLPAVCILPFALLLGGLLARRPAWLASGGASVGATIAYRTWLNRGLNVPWRYVWTHPLAAAVFTGILARSFWRSVSGQGVDWRGRVYQARQAPTIPRGPFEEAQEARR